MKIVFKIILVWSLATQLAALEPAGAAELAPSPAPASPGSPSGPAGESRPLAVPAADPGSTSGAAPAPQTAEPSTGRLPPAPGMPNWARPAAPALGPTIELDPDHTAEPPAAGAPAPPSRGAARNLTMTLVDRVRGTISQTTLGGYGEFSFSKYPGQDSSFDPRRFVLFLYSPLTQRISVATEVEWEHGGSPTKRDGQAGVGDVKLEFSVLDFKLWDALTLRAGVLLMPLGRLNVNHDAPSLELTDRPLVDTYIIPSTWSEVGAGITGRVNTGPVLLAYELYVVNGLDSAIADGPGLQAARGSLLQDNNSDKAVTGRVSAYYYKPRGRWRPNFELGLSGYSGEYDRSHHRVNLLAGDLLLRNAYLELAGEYARAFIDGGFDDDYALSSRLPVPSAMQGFYLELRGRLPLRLVLPGLRTLPLWLGEASLLATLRYEEVDTDLAVINLNDRRRLSVGLNLRLSAALVFKHELQFTVNDAGGVRREVSDHPDLGYVSSIAFLF